MWKDILQPGRLQMTIWRTHVPARIPKATNIHSVYVFLIDFPLQQCLLLSVTSYVHCLSWSIIKRERVFMLCGPSCCESLNRFRANFLFGSSVPTWSLLFIKEGRSQNYKSGNTVNASEGLRYAYPCRPASSHFRKVIQLICYSPYRRAGLTIDSCTREKRRSNFDGLSDKQIGFRFMWPCIVSKIWREKTNKMQQLDVY